MRKRKQKVVNNPLYGMGIGISTSSTNVYTTTDNDFTTIGTWVQTDPNEELRMRVEALEEKLRKYERALDNLSAVEDMMYRQAPDEDDEE